MKHRHHESFFRERFELHIPIREHQEIHHKRHHDEDDECKNPNVVRISVPASLSVRVQST